MMARMAGLDFFPMDTDMDYDDKVYGIMSDVGGGDPMSTAGKVAGWSIDRLLREIFAQGYALELNRARTAALAQAMAMPERDLDLFVEICVSHNLFDRGLWESCRVITSRGIQRRWAAAKKLSASKMAGEWVLPDDAPEISREVPKSPEISRDFPRSSEISREVPKSPVEEKRKEKEKEKKKEKEKAGNPPGGMADTLPCLAVPAEGSSVFVDLEGRPHRTALGAIAGSYACAGGRDMAGFAARMRGICPAGCRGDPAHAEECYQLVLRALEKFDPAKGRDPWPLTKTILEQERGR